MNINDRDWWLGRRFVRDGILFVVSSFDGKGHVRLIASDGSSGTFWFTQIRRAYREGFIQEAAS